MKKILAILVLCVVSSSWSFAAIDNAEKRRSAGMVGVRLKPKVTPNASKDAQWRIQGAGRYSGLIADPSVGGKTRINISIGIGIGNN